MPKFSLPKGEEQFICESCGKPYLLIRETFSKTTVYRYNPSPAMWLDLRTYDHASPDIEIRCEHCAATDDDTGWRVDEDEYGEKVAVPLGVNVASWATQFRYSYQDLRRAYRKLNIPRTLLPQAEVWTVGVERDMMVARVGLLYETHGDLKVNPKRIAQLENELADAVRRLPSFQLQYCRVLNESIDDHYNPLGVVVEARVGLKWQYLDEATEKDSVAEYWKMLYSKLSVWGKQHILPITCSPTAMLYFVTLKFEESWDSEADAVSALMREGLFPIESMKDFVAQNREWHVWCIRRDQHGEAIKLMLRLAGITWEDLMPFGQPGQLPEWHLMLPSSHSITGTGMARVKNKLLIAFKGAALNLQTEAEEIRGKWYTRTRFEFDPALMDFKGLPK
jgi:hypothetical protein